MSKVNDFIQSVFKATSASDGNLKTTDSTLRQFKSNSPLGNQQAINHLTTQLQDNKKPKPVSENQTRYPAYELSLVLSPDKKAIPYGALEIYVIKHIFKQQGINISNGAAEAVAEKAKLDFTPKWDAGQQKYVHNDKDGLYYRDSSFGKNSDMVLAGKKRNANGIEFNGYKFPISSDLQASILAEKDFALDVTKNGGKAFLEKSFNERFGMTLDKALAELPADIREKLKQIDAKTLLSAMMVGGVAIAALKKLPSRAVAVVAAGLTLKDIIQYGAEANHIADQIKNSTKAGDLPVEELKSLITNGGLDILLAGVGYAGVKLAPKFAKLGDDALKLTDDVARKFDDAYQATKGKVADLANKVDDALSPGMVTTEGIRIKVPQQKTPLEKINDPLEISISSEKANKPHIKRGDRPPYSGLRAQEIILKQETVFVRVHNENLLGSWLMRKKDIDGLTAQQIKDKFALPDLPTKISEIYVPAGTRVRVGIAAPQKGWGIGGGTQYELIDKIPVNSFRNTRELK